MSIRCDKIKCYYGEMDSKIGTQSFRMHLSTQGNTEQWEVSSTNAGALFKALGMYDSMRAGSLMLIVNTSRKDDARVDKAAREEFRAFDPDLHVFERDVAEEVRAGMSARELGINGDIGEER